MIDAREVDARKAVFFSAINKPVAFSAFRYLWLVLPIPFYAWYWAGAALHKLELDWVRANPTATQSLTEACQIGGASICALHIPVAWTHWLALALLLFILKFMLVVASLPNWSLRWQERFLRHAVCLGALGLLLTLVMVIMRGVLGAMLIWFVPQIWWGNDTLGVQLAAIVGIVAVIRVPPHVMAAWRLWRGFSRTRTGKSVSSVEAPALWELITTTCQRLEVALPDYLVMGVVPDCRLDIGKMQLEPNHTILNGRILYISATLITSLDQDKLTQLIEHALLRSRGKFGSWLPTVEDWLESSSGTLQEYKSLRASGGLPSAVDPALFCWEGWLLTLKKMLLNFKEEHAYQQKRGMEYAVEQAAPDNAAILQDASLSYRKDVFHLFIVNLSSGVHCPAVLVWFARAFAQRRPKNSAPQVNLYTNATLDKELVLLEKEWLVKTSQASTPSDCWELRLT